MPRRARGYYLRQDRKSGRWEIAWTDAGTGRVRSRSTGETDRTLAAEVLARWLDKLARPDAPETVTLREIAARYGEHLDARSRHAKGHRSALGRFCAKLGWLRFDEVRKRHGATYAEQRAREGVKPGTARQEITMASAMFAWWSELHGLTRPALAWPERPQPRRRWLTEDEADRLRAACKAPHVRLFVEIALGTGGRTEAILDLTWRQVDLERRIVDFGYVARGKRRAAVPIGDELAGVLAEAKEMATTPYVIEHNGGRIHRVQSAFKRAAKAAGLPDVSPHDLRRTFGSWLIQRGVGVKFVSEMLGHGDVRITQEVYGVVDVEHLRGAVEKLARKR